ncbi:MAG: hypothetical protein WB991_18070, partial [Candidatus Sulfotelmatobacter sp.]
HKLRFWFSVYIDGVEIVDGACICDFLWDLAREFQADLLPGLSLGFPDRTSVSRIEEITSEMIAAEIPRCVHPGDLRKLQTTQMAIGQKGQREGNYDSDRFRSRTLRYSLRRAMSLDSVDGGTHNPKVGGSNPPPATNAIIELRGIWIFDCGLKWSNKN